MQLFESFSYHLEKNLHTNLSRSEFGFGFVNIHNISIECKFSA